MAEKAIHSLGYWFVLTPVMLNVVILLVSAVVINKLLGQEYPWRRVAENDITSQRVISTENIDQEAG